MKNIDITLSIQEGLKLIDELEGYEIGYSGLHEAQHQIYHLKDERVIWINRVLKKAFVFKTEKDFVSNIWDVIPPNIKG